MARTCALFLSFHPALHRLLCSNETIQNVPKHYEMILGSNDVDRLCSLWKIAMWHRGTNLCLIAPFQPVLHRVSSINETLPNAPQHYEINKNMSLGFNRVERVHSFWKILTWLHGSNLCLNSIILAQFCIDFRVVTKQSKMHPNTMKCTKSWV